MNFIKKHWLALLLLILLFYAIYTVNRALALLVALIAAILAFPNAISKMLNGLMSHKAAIAIGAGAGIIGGFWDSALVTRIRALFSPGVGSGININANTPPNTP